MSAYKLHTLKIHNDGSSAVIIRDLLNVELPLNPELMAEVVGHLSTPDHVAYMARKPVLTGSTYDIKGILDAIGVTGLGIVSATNPGVVLALQKHDANGNPASGSVHRTFTLGDGVLVPRTLTCDHQGDYRIEFQMTPITDGTNATVTIADNAALPSVTQAASRWTLGKIVIGGITLTKYTNVSIDFGNNVTARGSQSLVEDTHIEQRTHDPSITISGIDPAWFASGAIPIGGAAVVNATDRIYLRKRTQDDDHFVGDATETHIAFSLAGLAAIDSATRAQAVRISETSLVIRGAMDGSGNMPLVVDTTAAIT